MNWFSADSCVKRRGAGVGVGLVLAGLLAAGTAVAGGTTLAPPGDVAIAQIEYGLQSEALLSWTNGEAYDAVQLFVDGEAAARVDGSLQDARLEVSTGTHVFAIEGAVGQRVSERTEVSFEILEQAPEGEPVRNVDCEEILDRGGRLQVRWEPGDAPWVEGLVEVPGQSVPVTVAENATETEVPARGLRPEGVTLRFRSSDGYFYEPIVVACSIRRPAFIRGDCNSSGRVNILDPIKALGVLFAGAPRWACDDSCDANDDSNIDVSDAVFVLEYLFRDGPPPPFPGGVACGLDLTVDFLGGSCECQ